MRIGLNSVVVKGVGDFLVPTYFITGFGSHCSDVFNLKRYWNLNLGYGISRARSNELSTVENSRGMGL